MRFVSIKTDDQLDLQALHRVPDRLITRRTSVINQLRAFLLERGLVFAKSPAKLRERMPEIPMGLLEGAAPLQTTITLLAPRQFGQVGSIILHPFILLLGSVDELLKFEFI